VNARKLRVVLYARVSSDEQRENQTIRTQVEILQRWAEHNADTIEVVALVDDDDGVSGTLPLDERPGGRKVLALAQARAFDQLVVTMLDRLGRRSLILLMIPDQLEKFSVSIFAVQENVSEPLDYELRAVLAADERRRFLKRSSDGMDRAAREGRYTGGITPLGYRVEGRKHLARLVPDEEVLWGDWSAAEVVRRIYHWLAVERRSCRWIANELNTLGVPTVYARDGRGVRGKATQALWRPGRIRNLVVNPVYKGELTYGRRRSKNSKRTEVITAEVPPLVTPEIWAAAQQTMTDNRILARNTERIYLLRGVIKCALCGLSFCGSQGDPGVAWYRCTGYMSERGPKEHRCQAKAIRHDKIEPHVWLDIETFLRNPGALLATLEAESHQAPDDSRAEAEKKISSLKAAIAELEPRRQQNFDLYERRRIDSAALDERLNRIDAEQKQLEARLAAIQVPERPEQAPDVDLLAALSSRLDAGLTDEQRSEIVRLLVKQITVHTTMNADGTKDQKFVIEYRFSQEWCSPNRNGMDSSLPGA